MGNDPFDEFEFKPLTEGLGFHKKAEKIKSDIKASPMVQDKVARSVPDVPPRAILFQNDALIDETSQSERRHESKSASQSISELIASLPPSLDFVDSKYDENPSSHSEPTSSMSASAEKSRMFKPMASEASDRPQIFQPLARQDYKAPSGPSAPAGMGTTIGQVLSSTISPPTVPGMPGSGKSGSGMMGGMPGVPGTLSSVSAAAAVPAPTLPQPGSSPYRERLDESYARAFPHAEKSIKRETGTGKDRSEDATVDGSLQTMAGNPISGVLDGMVISGVATILLVCILAITKVNLVGLLGNAQTDGPTQITLALLFTAVLHIYLLTSRSFFGSSLGEWAFDIQLGSDQDQKKAVYPLKVAWRILLLTLTGFILIPIISMIARRDLLKPLTGLQLYRRV